MTTESFPGTFVPFAIRAHHLPNFQYLFYVDWSQRSQPLTPGQVAYWSAEAYRRLMEAGDVNDKRSLQEAAHAKDTAGSTKEEQSLFEKRSKTLYKAFLDLDVDHPVEITTKPDEMCRICIIGNHCKLFKPDPTDSSNALAVDTKVMNMFIERVQRTFEPGTLLLVAEDEVIYEDAGKFSAQKVLTTAGIVHAFLRTAHPINFSFA